MFRFISAICLIFMFAGTASLAEDRRVIALSATAEISAEPDIASFSAGVTTQAPTAAAAAEENAAALGSVLEALTELGIPPEDLRTNRFTIQPVYQRQQQRDELPVIGGYRVQNTLFVRLRDAEMLGTALDTALKAGANTIGSIRFDVEDADSLLDEARTKALEAARRKADLYAEAGNFELGGIISLSENRQGQGPQPEYAMARMSADSAAPVATGSLTFSVQVNVTWEITENSP